MSPLRPIQRPRWARAAAASIPLLLSAAAPALRAAEVPFPPATTFRDLQLQTVTCARDNRRDSCDAARRTADPLLDNPRLSSRCKDTLWSIRQTAVSVESNTPERRDRLDAVARDLSSFCRQLPPPASSGSGGSGSGGKTFNLRPATTSP